MPTLHLSPESPIPPIAQRRQFKRVQAILLQYSLSQVCYTFCSTEKQVSWSHGFQVASLRSQTCTAWRLKPNRCSRQGVPLQQLIVLLLQAETWVHLNFPQWVKSPRHHSHLLKYKEQPPKSQTAFCILFVARLFRAKLHGRDSQPHTSFQVRPVFAHFLRAAGNQQHRNRGNVRQFLSYSESVFWSHCTLCPSRGLCPRCRLKAHECSHSKTFWVEGSLPNCRSLAPSRHSCLFLPVCVAAGEAVVSMAWCICLPSENPGCCSSRYTEEQQKGEIQGYRWTSF